MKKILLVCVGAFVLLVCAFTSKWEPPFDIPSSEQMIRIDSIKTINPDSLVSITDPVCGMDLRESIADTTLVNGKLYGFCSPACKKEFLKKMKNNSKSKTKEQ